MRYKRVKQRIIATVIAYFFPLAIGAQTTMPLDTSVFLDEVTINKGMTIGSPGGEVVLAVPPKSLSGPGRVQFVFQAIDESTLPEGYDHLGWSFLVALGEEIGIIKPLPLLLKIGDTSLSPVVGRWDDARAQWELMSTRVRWKQKEALVPITQTGIYALFLNTKRHLRGRATWYPDRLSKDSAYAAASNEYPLRTMLKVTNVQTLESVVVKVQSVGPFVKGRILDLTKTAFSKIGYPRKQGVLEVVVEPVK